VEGGELLDRRVELPRVEYARPARAGVGVVRLAAEAFAQLGDPRS
jgi:hypothetical protein